MFLLEMLPNSYSIFSWKLISTNPWNISCGHYFFPYGLLLQLVFGAIWSSSRSITILISTDTWSTQYGCFLCHLEYSMWSLFHAMWSLQYHSILMPYGVLHKALKTSHMDRFIFLCYEAFHIALYLCTRQQFTLIFSFFKAQFNGSQFSYKWNFSKIPNACFYSYNVYL